MCSSEEYRWLGNTGVRRSGLPSDSHNQIKLRVHDKICECLADLTGALYLFFKHTQGFVKGYTNDCGFLSEGEWW